MSTGDLIALQFFCPGAAAAVGEILYLEVFVKIEPKRLYFFVCKNGHEH
jgi:hypothetical protein